MTHDESAIQKCLVESPHISKIVEVCDKEHIHYVSGLLEYNELDPEDPAYDSVYLLFDILVENGEMSEREALTLLDNSLESVLTGISGVVSSVE